MQVNTMRKAKERLDPWSEDVEEIQAFLHIQRYERATKEVEGLILDVGCGFGYGSTMLLQMCAKASTVVAIDTSSTALSHAKRHDPEPIYMRSDAQGLPFKDVSFDSVVALEVIEHVDDGAYLLGEVHRVLRDEGILILSTPNADHLGARLEYTLSRKKLPTRKPKNPYHKHEYTPKELAALLESAGFTIEEKWGQILTFPLVHRLPVRLHVNTGRFLPDLSFHVICKARKNRSQPSDSDLGDC